MSEVQTTLGITDVSFTKLIDAIVEHPIIMIGFSFLLIFSFMFYRRPKELLELIKSAFSFRIFRKHRIITKQDLINHQLFKDLEYLINYKINHLYNNNANYSHFDKAKLAIAHDLLMIKVQDIKDWMSEFISKTNFNDPYLNIRYLLKQKFDKHDAYVWGKWKELGIPELFIEKFVEISRIHSEYMSLVLDDILSDKIPLSIYERMFLTLGCLSQYYTTMVLRMKDVIGSINGDLKGLIYKGTVIGGNDYRCYPVPSREYIPIVEKRLHELSFTTKAKRISIYVLHDYIGDDYIQGYFSKIYEWEATGFAPLMLKFQYKPATMLVDVLSKFKQHQGVVKDVTEINEVSGTLLSSSGITGFITYPIFLYDSLKGFIALEYNSNEIFKNIDTKAVLADLKKYTSLLNVYLDYTKTGFSYAGNKVKE